MSAVSEKQAIYRLAKQIAYQTCKAIEEGHDRFTFSYGGHIYIMTIPEKCPR